MTEEEAWALDGYWTEYTPKLSGGGNIGFFAKHREKEVPLSFWIKFPPHGCTSGLKLPTKQPRKSSVNWYAKRVPPLVTRDG
jgi:hypothetical protein